jgi:methylglutaconyl-CoA hydratase
VETTPDVRVIILAANGKSFSAGADLNWMKRMAGYSSLRICATRWRWLI